MSVWYMNMKMLYYDRIDVSEGIYVNKISELKKCDICHYFNIWKVENYKFKKIYKKLKLYIKMEKTITEFGEIEIEKKNSPT